MEEVSWLVKYIITVKRPSEAQICLSKGLTRKYVLRNNLGPRPEIEKPPRWWLFTLLVLLAGGLSISSVANQVE
jgi:hypothetical protein